MSEAVAAIIKTIQYCVEFVTRITCAVEPLSCDEFCLNVRRLCAQISSQLEVSMQTVSESVPFKCSKDVSYGRNVVC